MLCYETAASEIRPFIDALMDQHCHPGPKKHPGVCVRACAATVRAIEAVWVLSACFAALGIS